MECANICPLCSKYDRVKEDSVCKGQRLGYGMSHLSTPGPKAGEEEVKEVMTCFFSFLPPAVL